MMRTAFRRVGARVLLVAAGLMLAAAVPQLEAAEGPAAAIQCEGLYPHHLQGVCRDEQGNYFWSFTTRLVKTDSDGKLQKQVEVANHHGDLCQVDGKLYVAVNLGKFNQPAGQADSWVYVYDARDLRLISKHATPEVVHGAGGVAYHNGRFLVVGGLPPETPENYAYEYDRELRFRKRHVLQSGYTLMGIQTVEFADGRWWFGCYGNPQSLLVADEELRTVKRYEFDCSLGIIGGANGKFLVARGRCSKDTGCRGELRPAKPSPERGLVLEETGAGQNCGGC